MGNPDLCLEYLFNAAVILRAVGLAKNVPSLRLLGDYVITMPSRFRPLLAYRYQLLGAAGGLEEKVGKPIESALNELLNILEKVADLLKEKTGSEGCRLHGLPRGGRGDLLQAAVL